MTVQLWWHAATIVTLLGIQVSQARVYKRRIKDLECALEMRAALVRSVPVGQGRHYNIIAGDTLEITDRDVSLHVIAGAASVQVTRV